MRSVQKGLSKRYALKFFRTRKNNLAPERLSGIFAISGIE